MLIGIDFDNTIICYDQAFHQAALEKNLIPAELPAVKNRVRDYLRSQDHEEEWIELQGLVYGSRIASGIPFPGVLEFLAQCSQHDISICIISHRSKFPFRGYPYDMHEAAQGWLESHDFKNQSGLGAAVKSIHFEFTEQDKVSRIRQTVCSYFIDDLPTFLAEPGFPSDVKQILFDPDQKFDPGSYAFKADSWDQIGEFIIGENQS